jgi:hypothetical protein
MDHLGKIATSTDSCAAWSTVFTLRAMPLVSYDLFFYISTHGHSCSGAEGTIIEEPDNLPRVIWGLDSAEQHSDDFGTDSKTKKQEVSAQPLQSFRHSPRQYKPSADTQLNSPRERTLPWALCLRRQRGQITLALAHKSPGSYPRVTLTSSIRTVPTAKLSCWRTSLKEGMQEL